MQVVSTENLPLFKNWVSEGKIPPVKDQGSCSSCWAHVAVTTIEAAVSIVYKKPPPSLSRQILVDCANPITGGPVYSQCNGCNRGDASQGILFAYWFMLPTEAAYPYVSGTTNKSGTCQYNYMKMPYTADYVQGFQVNYYENNNEEILKAAVVMQPVVIYWCISTFFQNYKANMFTVAQQTNPNKGCSTTSNSLDHAMVVVGYNVTSAKHYWIIQNSWGTDWGQEGYIWVEMTGDKNGPCGMYTYIIGPVLAFKHVPSFYQTTDPKKNIWMQNGLAIVAGSHDHPSAADKCAMNATVRALVGGAGVNCNQVSSVAISPDSSMVAAGVWDYTARLFRVANQQPIKPEFSGHKDRVTAVAFSADGVYLASGSADGTVKIWDVINMKLAFTLTGHSLAVQALAFSRDGTILATGSDDTTVRLWNVTSVNNKLNVAPPFITALKHVKSVLAIAWAADSQMIMTGGADGTIRLWQRTPVSPYFVPKGLAVAAIGAVFAVSISPSGLSMASAGSDYTVKLWDMKSFGQGAKPLGWFHGGLAGESMKYSYWSSGINGQTKQIMIKDTSHTDQVMSVAFSPDGTIVVSGGYDKTLRVFDTKTFKQIIAISDIDVIKSVAFSSDGGTIVTGGFSGRIKFYTLQAPRPKDQI